MRIKSNVPYCAKMQGGTKLQTDIQAGKVQSECRLLDGNAYAEYNTLYELEPDISLKWFNNCARFGRYGTIGDGSCFFHSVCLAMNYNGYTDETSKDERTRIVMELRNLLADTFESNSAENLKFIAGQIKQPIKEYIAEEVCKKMRIKSAWADEFMIRWSSHVLKRNIVFMNVSKNENSPYCSVHSASTEKSVKHCEVPKEPMIIVAWVNSNHFELIVRIDDIEPQNETVTVTTQFDSENPDDLNTIYTFMAAYIMSCNIMSL